MRKYILFVMFLCMHCIARGQGTTIRCWFDNDPATMKSFIYDGNVNLIDVNDLIDGIHLLHVQVDGPVPSSPVSHMFIKVPQTVGVDYLTCMLYVDGTLFKKERVSASGGVVNWSVSATSLAEGLHRAHVMVITPSGAVTSAYEAFFLRVPRSQELAAMKCYYRIDGQAMTNKAGTVSDGLYHFDLDLSNIEDGLHRITYMLNNGKGLGTQAQTQFFVKIPLGGYGITQYEYWLNDHDADAVVTTLDPRQENVQILSLLPLVPQPIRSSCFQFAINNGQPVVYAKNDLYVRFHDASNRFVDAHKQFVDENVMQQVTNLRLLRSGKPTTTDKPAVNAIKWYSVNVEPGDTVAFKSSQACTLQLFSPSGEEVYSASGSDAVAYGGCHTWESGTYYLAVHDVMGSQSQITLDYMHMDKYDVVRQDVSVVGNGGCSTITFDGNGFRDLYAVDLLNSQGDTIHHVYIGHESDATTSVVFDFTDAALGKYNAVFHFADEDKVFNNLITVEEARDIELATTVTYPSTFLQGTSTTFTIKITNKGNMTAYAVPIKIQLFTQSLDAISEIELSKNAPSLNLSWMNENEIPVDSIQLLMNYIESNGDMLHFINAYDSIDCRYFKEAHFAIDIPSRSTYVLTVTIKSSESVEIQTLTPSMWNSCMAVIDETVKKARLHRKNTREEMCCVRETVECVMNAIVYVFDFASFFPQANLADCIASLANTTLQYAYDVWCGEELGGKNPRKAAEDLVWDAINSLIGCIIPGGEKWELLRNMKWVYQHIYNNISTTMDCVKALTQEIPNCPPNPNNGGGSSNPVQPSDPNDIYGYTAESGSHAVKDGLTDVYYRIEFENDTTFATASAHDIYLTDTLDSKKFDLSTFRPTRVRIGEKSAELTGEKNFVTTIDMRPEINAIAQVEGTYDQKKGIAKWHISSLDPMTMEPTTYVMDGVLPVNYDGKGIGEVMFDIALKPGLKNGTEIPNRAGIVFDTNDVIMTPTWTNIIDRTAPVSNVADVVQVNDTTAQVSISAGDNLSGPWRYDVYVQYDSGAWFLAAENVPVDSVAKVHLYEGINHGFCTICTDEAGNVEQKPKIREQSLDLSGGVYTNASLMDSDDVDGEQSADVYDLQGHKSTEAEAAKGVIIKNRKKTVKR